MLVLERDLAAWQQLDMLVQLELLRLAQAPQQADWLASSEPTGPVAEEQTTLPSAMVAELDSSGAQYPATAVTQSRVTQG